MEMIVAIENMNLTLHIPDDSIAAEIALVESKYDAQRFPGSPVPPLYLE